MEIKLVNNQLSWDSWLVANCRYARFSQSWEWGEILKAEGKQTERLAIIENNVIVAQAQVVYTKLPLGRNALCPRGPVFPYPTRPSDSSQRVEQVSRIPYQQAYQSLIGYLKNNGCIFFRIEPQPIAESRLRAMAEGLQTQKVSDINPCTTTILDVSKLNDIIFANMHEKTRYNIRLAQKKELTVRTEKDIGTFLMLSKKTAKRDGFRLHPWEHYKNILVSPLTHQITLYNGELPIAVALFVGFGNTFTYLFGASDHEFRHLMAPHLIQWEGIALARQRGFRYYDFFGIAPNTNQYGVGYDYDAEHQYAGVTRFKLGFGGKIIEDPGTFDLIISPKKYRIYQALRRLRRLI